MKHLKLFEDFINESIKFKLSPELDSIINNIENKKKAQIIESMLVKSLLTDFLQELKTKDIVLDKKFSNSNTQQKIDFLFNTISVPELIRRNYVRKLTSISDYVHSNPIVSNNFEELYLASVKWHEDVAKGIIQTDTKNTRTDETDNTDKFITYPNGWYWINLNTHYSADEASNMGHCGRDAGKILMSLRDNNSNSHITVSYDPKDKAMYQCKGRGNTKPKSEYHKYIIDLLLNEKYPFTAIMTGSYKPELDFNLKDLTDSELENLLSKKPTLEYTDDMFDIYINHIDWIKIVSMIENGFEYYGDKKIHDMSFLKFIITQKVDLKNYINTEFFDPILDDTSTEEDFNIYLEYYNGYIKNLKLKLSYLGLL